MLASTGSAADMNSQALSYSSSFAESTSLREHAIQRNSPYAIVTPPGWQPKEPGVRPTAAMTGAGVVSGGSIDNTYTPRPLVNQWGKARELAANEFKKPAHKQATDLLVVAMGGKMPPPAQNVADMDSVRPTYSRTIPVFHQLDPQRYETGFVRGPNIIPGAKPPPGPPYNSTTYYPDLPPDHKIRKLAYDQQLETPVSKIVKVDAGSAKPSIKAAGLPGGLSLTHD